MSKVFISRQDGSVSWGFRLQGGLEYNEPLTVTNIVPNSPADGKLDPGDMLMEVAGNNVSNMSHRDALELIQRCANALFLTVHKVGYSYPPGATGPRPAPITPMWKPPAQQQQPPSYYQQDFPQQQQQQQQYQPPQYQQNLQQQQQYQPPQYQQNLQQQQPPSYYQQNFQQQQQQPPYYQHDFQPHQQQQQYGYGQPPIPIFNAPPPAPAPPPPPPMPAANIPPPPIFDADLIANAATALKSRPVVETQTSYEQTTEISNIPAALAKSLGRPGGPKPFTYTPGGLDLSKIRESARVRRHREYTSNSEEPNDTEESEINMNRRTNAPAAQVTQHQYAPQNPSQPPMNYNRQQTAPVKKPIQHDTDVVTQSRSFQMLQGWISDSEKTVPTAVPPPSQQQQQQQQPSPTNKSAVARAVHDEQMGNTKRRTSSSSTSTLPSRSFRYLQEQYNNGENNDAVTTTTTTTTVEETVTTGEGAGLRRGSDGHMPSRAFKYIQDQYDAQHGPVNRPQGINNREDLVEIYNKPPPSFRQREPEAPRYTGSTVPSRSFRFLQMMTQDDQQNDTKSVPGYNKPQPLMNKSDDQNFSLNTNKINTHPSRSFKYLQEMTSDQQQQPDVTTTMTTVTRTERQVSATNNGQPLKMNVEIRKSQPIIQVNTTSSSNQGAIIDNLAADIAATDF